MLAGSLDQLISDWAWEILFSTSGAGKTQEADVYTVSLKPKSGHYQQLQPIAAMSSQLLAAANCSHLQPHLLRAAICSNLQQLAHSSHLSSHLQPLAAICRENSQTAPGECWEFSGAFNRRASCSSRAIMAGTKERTQGREGKAWVEGASVEPKMVRGGARSFSTFPWASMPLKIKHADSSSFIV